MTNGENTNLIVGSGKTLIEVDDQLLVFLKQFSAMGLAESWEVRINGPIKYCFTASKLMQKLVKKMNAQTDRHVNLVSKKPVG